MRSAERNFGEERVLTGTVVKKKKKRLRGASLQHKNGDNVGLGTN